MHLNVKIENEVTPFLCMVSNVALELRQENTLQRFW